MKKEMVSYIIKLMLIAMTVVPVASLAHDTTHIHPLITEKISTLIEQADTSIGSYKDIYVELPNEQKDDSVNTKQRLYWGTDFDAGKNPGELTKEWLLEDRLTAFNAPLNVINGTVQEDIPDSKVKHHFYQADSGQGLLTGRSILDVKGDPSSGVAMGFFNKSIEYFGMYDESAKQVAFFTFGQALHHVEDMLTPAHIHNDAENVLFAPILRYDQLKNTHVVASTLRFFKELRFGWKQTGSFSGVVV